MQTAQSSTIVVGLDAPRWALLVPLCAADAAPLVAWSATQEEAHSRPSAVSLVVIVIPERPRNLPRELEQVRRAGFDAPVVLLGARLSRMELALAFAAGVCDVITLPAPLENVAVRLRSARQRGWPLAPATDD